MAKNSGLCPYSELDYQRTNAALGKEVDVERILEIAWNALDRVAEKEEELDDNEASEEARDKKAEALEKARVSDKATVNMRRWLTLMVHEASLVVNALREKTVPPAKRIVLANCLQRNIESATKWGLEPNLEVMPGE